MNQRRHFLLKSVAAVAASAIVLPFGGVAKAPIPSIRKRMLRVAHLTDIHVQPEGAAAQGMINALHTAQNLADKPDLILFGGDCIMDALNADKDRTKQQWSLWNNTLKNDCGIEFAGCIGNHDVWGWSRKFGKKTTTKDYGKKWASDELKLNNRYYSFDRAGWHFVVLDSTQPKSIPGYTAHLDEEQFDWLQKDLAATDPSKYVLVLSHIPILGASVFFDGDLMKHNKWQVPGSWMHTDAKRIKDVFYKHKNVKLALSGHIHLIDSVEYLGVKYLCNGAVSGAWWGGNCQEFAPAFAVMNLYDDGTSEHEMVYYKWKV